jgi:hypothetical protein
MRKTMAAVLLIGCLAGLAWGASAPAFAGATEYGKLTVYSDVPGSDIYVDAKFVGQDRATISNIPIGKHYVRVVKDDRDIKTGIVDVREGEETIIVAKPDENLLSKMRKPNRVALFGAITGAGYSFPAGIVPGTTSFDLKPQYGIGAELKYPVPVIDVNIDLGFILGMPSTLHFYDSGAWYDGQLSISSPYICLSKELLKRGSVRLSLGGGFNYALYTPGGGLQLSTEPRLGYTAYIEGTQSTDMGQQILVKLGYVSYAGKVGVTDITSAGYFVQAGMAYQL